MVEERLCPSCSSWGAKTLPRPWLPRLKSPLFPFSHPPGSVGGSSLYPGSPLGQTLLGQGLCLPKSGYMLPPP